MADSHSQADAIVFFGVTGDLAYKQIFPALQAMIRRGHLAVPIIGVASRPWSIDQLRAHVHDSLQQHGGVDQAAFAKLCSLLQYVSGDYREAATFATLRQALGSAARPLYYLAIPPSLFGPVVDGLGRSGCATGARAVLEKPFGRDLASAQHLNQVLHAVFPESAIFRIDHYLGKEPVQNHLLQLVALLAMEPPCEHAVEAVRSEKARIFKSMRPLDPAHVVRGQYRGYRQEEGVAPDSPVETFAAVRLFLDSWRWAGVPFYIRAGKQLPVTTTEILVALKSPPQSVFGEAGPPQANSYRFRLSPDVLISLCARAKLPGEAMRGEDVELVACRSAGDEQTPYERLLGDAMRGEASLFVREDSVEAAWAVVEPVLGNVTPVHEYAPHTWGPPEADRIIAHDWGWHNPVPTEPEAAQAC